MQVYSDPERENDAWALPDVEVFYAWEGELEWEGQEEPSEEGWYYWFCCPVACQTAIHIGPFETEAEAINDARESE
jgi:hypothetical protein